MLRSMAEENQGAIAPAPLLQPATPRWLGAPPQLAYDGDALRVVFQPGGSDLLLITFSDALVFANGLSFTADSMVRKVGLTCLGFMAKSANWFPAEAIARAVPHIDYTLRSFDRIMLYGCSMGAYAAIKHSRALRATDVLALAPQWSIDAAECAPWECGYCEYFRPHMRGMGIRSSDIAGRINILYDPGHPLDRRHVDAILRLDGDIATYHVHTADHHLAPILAGTETIFGIMLACLHRDTAEIYRLINDRRRNSPVRHRILMERLAVRRSRT